MGATSWKGFSAIRDHVHTYIPLSCASNEIIQKMNYCEVNHFICFLLPINGALVIRRRGKTHRPRTRSATDALFQFPFEMKYLYHQLYTHWHNLLVHPS